MLDSQLDLVTEKLDAELKIYELEKGLVKHGEPQWMYYEGRGDNYTVALNIVRDVRQRTVNPVLTVKINVHESGYQTVFEYFERVGLERYMFSDASLS